MGKGEKWGGSEAKHFVSRSLSMYEKKLSEGSIIKFPLTMNAVSMIFTPTDAQ